jgi:protein-disulfide isomerase
MHQECSVTRSRLIATLAAALAIPLAVACQRDDRAVAERLDSIDKHLQELTKAVASGARGGGPGARAERPRPKPDTTYSIPVEDSPARGPKDALVTVVEGFDFACPYCEQSRDTVEQLLESYPKDVRVVYKNFVVHTATATTPALAACAAHKQGKYAEMNKLIWDKGYKANRNLSDENMATLAQEVGLDGDRFKKDMASPDCKKEISEDQQQLAKVGVSGTPAFYVNGRWVQNRSLDKFKQLVDEELNKAKERVAQGTKPADYYKQWVVEKGSKTL